MTSAGPVSIKASVEERQKGKLSERNLEIAVRSVLKDGLVVVENAIDHQVLDELNKKMVADAMVLRDRGDNSPFNYNKGNLQQDAPPVRKYFDPSIFLSKQPSACRRQIYLLRVDPLASHITSTVLGSKPKLTFMSGNTAMPPVEGSPPMRQPVHSDADFQHPSHAFALVVNVGLIDMKPETGSTEVWLGTHTGTNIADQEGAHGERASGRIKEALLEQRRTIQPPVQPTIPKGSVVVRDLRLWHAGMPNCSSQARVMLAMSKE
jgi:ectoine hydroxylase-related dioxygenase (phytanoyl-CoA dioxygenase family)